MLSLHILAFLLCLIVNAKSDIQGWVNEFHYRNYKNDQNLFLEIVGPVGKEAWEYLVVLYQGRDGSQFNQALSLSGYSFNSGVVGDFGFIKYSLPNRKGSIRNGKVGSDGIALVYKEECIQFLCYGEDDESVFTAWSGPCYGKTCQNIGVHELSYNPLGKSIQMIGTGRFMENFTWSKTTLDWTPGGVNVGQKLQTMEEYLMVRFAPFRLFFFPFHEW
jgi:hypothetical protein